jgi:hypothetical protein
MHHSDDPKRRMVSVGCYADDSGTDGNSALAVVGGPIFPRKTFFAFSYEWVRILALHKVTPPIHMKEFARPDGRLAYLSDDQRRALLRDLVWAINKHKLYSITTAVTSHDFEDFFPTPKFKRLFSSAQMAFLLVLILNSCVVADHEQLDRMAYVISHSDVNGQMRDVHAFWQALEESTKKQSYTGALVFDRPSQVSALQAADMVAWSNRRNHLKQGFDRGFEPLLVLTRTVEGSKKHHPHFHYPISRSDTESFAALLRGHLANPKKIGHLDLANLVRKITPARSNS